MLAVAAGCGEGCAGTSTPTAAPDPEPEAQPETEPPPDPGPPPVLGLSVEAGRDGEVTLRIQNRGAEPAALSSTVAVERQEGDSWVAVEDVQLDLRFACDQEAPQCIRLVPGAEWIPPPWLGTTGASQCACEDCGDVPTGTYRLVVASCSGAHPTAASPSVSLR